MELVDGLGLSNGGCPFAEVKDLLPPTIMLRSLWLTDKCECLDSLLSISVRGEVDDAKRSYQKPLRTFTFLRPFVAKLQCLLPIGTCDGVLDGTYSALAHAQIRHDRASSALYACRKVVRLTEKVVRGIYVDEAETHGGIVTIVVRRMTKSVARTICSSLKWPRLPDHDTSFYGVNGNVTLSAPLYLTVLPARDLASRQVPMSLFAAIFHAMHL